MLYEVITIAYGSIKTKEGTWLLRDAYRQQGDVVKVIRRFEWKGTQTTTKTTLSARWIVSNSNNPQVIMPGVSYNFV